MICLWCARALNALGPYDRTPTKELRSVAGLGPIHIRCWHVFKTEGGTGR